jgi:hypothetical protein
LNIIYAPLAGYKVGKKRVRGDAVSVEAQRRKGMAVRGLHFQTGRQLRCGEGGIMGQCFRSLEKVNKFTDMIGQNAGREVT